MTYQSDKYHGRWSELDNFYQNNLENTMINKIYSFPKGLLKGVVSFLLFLVPVLLTSFPVWADLSVGAVLVTLLNFLKFKYRSL